MTNLSKKYYIAVAKILKEKIEQPTTDDPNYDSGYTDGVIFVADGIARYFEEDNPRFDRATFLEACGINEE